MESWCPSVLSPKEHGSGEAQRAALLLHPTYLLSQKPFLGLPHHTLGSIWVLGIVYGLVTSTQNHICHEALGMQCGSDLICLLIITSP